MRGGSRRRTRPDESGKPGYITRDGYRRLEEEAARLWNVERPKLTRAVAEAAAEGDRSENAEYIYGKRRLREIDRRLRFLAERMDALTVVRSRPDPSGRVYFGAFATLEEPDGSRREIRLVGVDESDPSRGLVSIASPLGRSLLGREEGDEILLRSPRGQRRLTLVAVRYASEPQGDA